MALTLKFLPSVFPWQLGVKSTTVDAVVSLQIDYCVIS
jgi:hypothetical protein